MTHVVIGHSSTSVVLRSGAEGYPIEALFYAANMDARFLAGNLPADPVADLERLRVSPGSVAHIASEDGFVVVKLTHDTLGEIGVDAQAHRDGPPDTYARLVFKIDQSFLPAIVGGLKQTFAKGRAQ